jgi:hypothetical protein
MNERLKGGTLAWDKKMFCGVSGGRVACGTTGTNTAKAAEKGGAKKRNGTLQKT